MRHMVVIVPELTGYATIRHVAVSLPYAAQLIDGVKYMEPGGLKPPEGSTERRRQRAPRAPSMRYLVKLAVKCDSAEQLGKKLRRCYQRQQQRQGWPGLAMAATRARSPRSLTDCSRTTDAARNRRKMKTDEHARFAYQRCEILGICRRTPSRPRNDHRATISATMARKTSAPRSDMSHTTAPCKWIPDRTTPKAFKVSITSR